MSATVRAVLSCSQRIGVDTSFPFFDLPQFLASLAPVRVDVSFGRLGVDKSIIDLEAEFDEPAAANSVALFKEVLIRSEVDLDLDCAFPPSGAAAAFDHDWASVHVQPEVACLTSGKALAVPLSLLSAAADILRQAHLTDSAVAYRVTLRKRSGKPELARLLVPALAELRRGQRAAGELEESVTEAVELVRSEGWSATEAIRLPTSGKARDQAWIETLIRNHLRRIAGFFPDDLLPLRWHSAYVNADGGTLQEIVARLRDGEFIGRLFERIVPSSATQRLLLACAAGARRTTRDPDRGKYAFISYAHRDAAFVDPLLDALRKSGANYWVDTRIDPGQRWDETLEDRIRNCGAVIACVSDQYQESKYCRRELKFADLINKPILPVAPSASIWQPGLQMMFQELQMTSFDGGRGFADLRRTLEAIAPTVFH